MRCNLSWNEFESCTSNSFKGLIAREEFVDVTLACDDDKQVKAHKVILSACSDFFRNILLKNSHQHPLIYLDNLKVEYLQALIDFMYLGETNIPQNMFSGFIKAAQKYKIKGLIERGETPQLKAKKRRHQSLNIVSTPVNIKEELFINEEELLTNGEGPVEVLKHTIVGTLANNQTKILEPETKLEVLDEEISQEGSNVVEFELTEVNVVEPMDDLEVGLMLDFDDEMPPVNDAIVENASTNLKREKSEVDQQGTSLDNDYDYLPNENVIFSDDESEDNEEVGSKSVEEEIEIESIVDRNETVHDPSLDDDGESVDDDDDDDSSENDEDDSDEEESSSDYEESLADEDTECEEDTNSDDDEIMVKEESTGDDETTSDFKPNTIDRIQQEEKLLVENIKKEQTLDESDFEFL